jgi:hypothetical protein
VVRGQRSADGPAKPLTEDRDDPEPRSAAPNPSLVRTHPVTKSPTAIAVSTMSEGAVESCAAAPAVGRKLLPMV